MEIEPAADRVLMTQVTHLKNQTKMMSLRIKELEGALSQSGLPVPEAPDPASSNGDSLNLSGLLESIGSLSIGADGQTRYHGDRRVRDTLEVFTDGDKSILPHLDRWMEGRQNVSQTDCMQY